MSKHVQWHATLTDAEERSGVAFSRMMFLIYFFADEATYVAN